MTISSLSGQPIPESIQPPSVSKQVNKTEVRTTSVSAAINAGAPEGILLGSKKIEVLSPSLLPGRATAEAVTAEARRILTKNQVSAEVAGGLDAVASVRLNPRFNRLLRATAEPGTIPEGSSQLLPEPEVYASGNVSVIFTRGKATIVGLEGNDLGQFLKTLERTNPDVATRLASVSEENVFFVSRKEEQEINELVDNKLALMATELREGLTEIEAEEERDEKKEEVEKGAEKGHVSELGGTLRRAVSVTPVSVLATAVNDVIVKQFFLISQESTAWLRAAAGMMLSNARQREREAAESSKKRQEETREIERQDIKEDQKHYEQTQAAIKSDQRRSVSQQEAARQENSTSSESIALGVFEQKRQAGEPASPPDPKTSGV